MLQYLSFCNKSSTLVNDLIGFLGFVLISNYIEYFCIFIVIEVASGEYGEVTPTLVNAVDSGKCDYYSETNQASCIDKTFFRWFFFKVRKKTKKNGKLLKFARLSGKIEDNNISTFCSLFQDLVILLRNKSNPPYSNRERGKHSGRQMTLKMTISCLRSDEWLLCWKMSFRHFIVLLQHTDMSIICVLS